MQDPTEIIEKIAVEKEVLSTMPKNNAKNVECRIKRQYLRV